MAKRKIDSSNSKRLYEEARRLIPGGVNSPVRHFQPYPLFMSYGKGSRLFDIDGNSYIDYCLGYGSLLFGHSDPRIILPVRESLEIGMIFGTPTRREVQLAKKITDLLPGCEMARLTNSGGEATMTALRLARGFTNRELVVKFDGGYHGANDYYLIKAGSAANGLGSASSTGIPLASTKKTLTVAFNDFAVIEKLLARHKGRISAIIVEPVLCNSGVIPPKPGYLKHLRKLADRDDILLIFDEVITAFRLSDGGAQEYFDVKADLVAFGKALGSGLPIGGVAGRTDIMSKLSPAGDVYHAGTFNGNPLCVTSALSVLAIIEKERQTLYRTLDENAQFLSKGLRDILGDRHISCRVNNVGSMLQVFFTQRDVTDYVSAQSSDSRAYFSLFRSLLSRGVYLPPSQFESCFLSVAHTKSELTETLEAVNEAVHEIEV
jgi:glutamate-1-semialdehyde 2,1-aminomutase